MKTKEIKTDVVELEISLIDTNPLNPRTTFPIAEMHELKESIKQQGIIQPVLVRPMGKRFQLVYGERRLKGSELAGLVTIPAQIKILSDEEALEIAITENLQRVDVAPMEEAAAFKNLMDINKYDVASLVLKFGKSEKYVRSRLRLNDLNSDIASMLSENSISLGNAIEISKYSDEIQVLVFSEHLDSGYSYNYWGNFSTRELSQRIERHYATQLDQYGFDKTECQGCPFNSTNYQLFSEGGEGGKCAKKSCLVQKNTDYQYDLALQYLSEKPDLLIHINYNSNLEVVERLKEAGYEPTELNNTRLYPTAPQNPDGEEFDSEEEKQEAKESYQQELMDYEGEMDFLKSQLEQGFLQEFIRIGSNDIPLGYTTLTEQKEEFSIDNEIAKLQNKDRRNKEIAGEKIVAGAKEIIWKAELVGDFSDFEEQIMYFTMLSALRNVRFEKFGLKKKYYLENEDKMKIVASLTEEQKTIIRRDFLVKNLTEVHGSAQELLLKFTRQHLPAELKSIEDEHNGVFKKRNKRLKERIALLKTQKKAA